MVILLHDSSEDRLRYLASRHRIMAGMLDASISTGLQLKTQGLRLWQNMIAATSFACDTKPLPDSSTSGRARSKKYARRCSLPCHALERMHQDEQVPRVALLHPALQDMYHVARAHCGVQGNASGLPQNSHPAAAQMRSWSLEPHSRNMSEKMRKQNDYFLHPPN